MAGLSDLARFALAFRRARRERRGGRRDELLARQKQRLDHFLARVLPRAPFYRPYAGRPLDELPIVSTRPPTSTHFAAMNCRGIRLEDALAVALEAGTQPRLPAAPSRPHRRPLERHLGKARGLPGRRPRKGRLGRPGARPPPFARVAAPGAPPVAGAAADRLFPARRQQPLRHPRRPPPALSVSTTSPGRSPSWPASSSAAAPTSWSPRPPCSPRSPRKRWPPPASPRAR